MIRIYRSQGADVEQGMRNRNGAGRVGHEQDIAASIASSNQWIIGLLFIFLFVSFFPITSLVFFLVSILCISGCLRAAARMSHQQLNGMERDNGGRMRNVWNGASIFSMPSQLDLVNLRLTLLNRDFNESDYDMLLALDEESGQSTEPPLSDNHLAMLPTHKYQKGTDAPKDASGTNGGTDGQEVCSVCLEALNDGDDVKTLPCVHHFHEKCILPWLKQQGVASTCPICKVSVFGS